MKLKKLGLMALTAGTALALAACNDIPTDTPTPDEPSTPLPDNPNPDIPGGNETPGTETPSQEIAVVQNITYSGEAKTLSWDKAANATGYVVNINGTIYNSSSPSLKLEDSFIDSHSGLFLEVKVYGFNSTKQGAYSPVAKILIGNDTATEEQLTEAIASEAEFLDLQEVLSFLEEKQITKTEFIMALNGETGNIGKEKCSYIGVYLAKNQLDSVYGEMVNPNYTEGQDKPLIQYIDDNFTAVSKAMETYLSVKNLADNAVILEAVSRFEELKNGTLSLDALLNLYANVRLQLDEAVPSEEDISSLISTAKDIIGIVAEENPAIGNRLYTALFQEELTGELTEAQLTALKTEISGLLDNVENILCSCMDLLKGIYSSISDSAMQEAVNLNQRIEENEKYLLNDELKTKFKTAYLSMVLSKAVMEECKSEDIQNSILAIVNELQTVVANEAVENLLKALGTILPVELPEDFGISAVVRELFGLITKENLQDFMETAGLALEPWTDATVVAAQVFADASADLYNEIFDDYFEGRITEEEYLQKIEAVEVLAEDAGFERAKAIYTSFRNVFLRVSEEELGLFASLIEEPVLSALQEQFTESMLETQEYLDYINQSANESSYDSHIAYLEEEIAFVNQQIQALEANNSDGSADSDIEALRETLSSLQAEKAEAEAEREMELAEKQEEIASVEQSLAAAQGYLDMVTAFAASEHDYTKNYFNILKDIQGIVQNITAQDIEAIQEILTQEDGLSDIDIITLLNYISKNNGDVLVKDIFDNIKIVASNEAIQAGDMLDEIEPMLDMLLEVGGFDAEKELTAEEQESLDTVKEILFGLMGSIA